MDYLNQHYWSKVIQYYWDVLPTKFYDSGEVPKLDPRKGMKILALWVWVNLGYTDIV